MRVLMQCDQCMASSSNTAHIPTSSRCFRVVHSRVQYCKTSDPCKRRVLLADALLDLRSPLGVSPAALRVSLQAGRSSATASAANVHRDAKRLSTVCSARIPSQ